MQEPMVIRPKTNGQRDMIVDSCDAWLLTSPPIKQLELYNDHFKSSADAYRDGITHHRNLAAENEEAAADLSECNIVVDEAARVLLGDVFVKHGANGLKKVEALFDGRTRGEFTRLPHRDQRDVQTEALRRIDAKEPGYTLLDAVYLAAFRAAHDRFTAAIKREDATRTARRLGLDALDDLRPTFDKSWTRFVGMIGPVLGERIGDLVPDFSREQAKKAKPSTDTK
jgi:hypothetical protein